MTDYNTIQIEAHKAWENPSVGDRFYCDRYGIRKVLKVLKVLNTRVVLEDGSYINLKSQTHSDRDLLSYSWLPVTPAVEASWAEEVEKAKASEGLAEMLEEVKAKIARLPYRNLHHLPVVDSGALRTKLEAILMALAE